MKLGLVAASLVLVAGSAVGCGDDGNGGGGADAPTTDEFCSALVDFQEGFGDTDPTKDLAAYIESLKEAAERLEEIGTPDDMPDDAREGFDLTIDTIEDLPDDATLDDLAKLGDVSEEDQKKLDALDEYIAETCPELDGDDSGGGDSGDEGDDSASEEPSETPEP